jgi:tetratricopeptide (TPR) repeat protein
VAAIFRKQLGRGDPRTAWSDSKVAVALIQEGRYAEAEALLQPALEVYERNLGRSHPEVAYILEVLGDVASRARGYEDAVARFRRALSIRQRDRKHVGLASTTASLAMALTRQAAAISNDGRLAESEAIFDEALELALKASGPQGALTGAVLGGIAWVKNEQGLYRRAEELYRQQYDIYLQTREHPDAMFDVPPTSGIQSAIRLGGVLVEEAQFDEAKKFFMDAVEMSAQLPVASADWDGTGQILGRLARLELRLGHDRVADEFATRSARLLGLAHPGHSIALDTQAGVRDAQGRCQEAYELLLQMRFAIQDAVGVDHSDVAYALVSLGNFGIRHQGLGAEAESAFREALRIRERHLGPRHPLVAWALIGLADSCSPQRPDDARPLLERALEIFDARFGSDYSDAAETLTDLAEIVVHQGQLAPAERLLERARRTIDAAFDSAHPDLAYVLAGFGHLHLHAGRIPEAIVAWQQSLRILEQKLGPDNPAVVECLDPFQEGLRELGRLSEADDLKSRADRIRVHHAALEPRLGFSVTTARGAKYE